MDIPESHVIECEFSAGDFDNDCVPPYKSSAASGVKAGLSTTGSVHELLECPVCTNSMYPPIHQVLMCGFHFFHEGLFVCWKFISMCLYSPNFLTSTRRLHYELSCFSAVYVRAWLAKSKIQLLSEAFQYIEAAQELSIHHSFLVWNDGFGIKEYVQLKFRRVLEKNYVMSSLNILSTYDLTSSIRLYGRKLIA